MTDIHDIKPLEDIGFDPTISRYIIYVLLVAIILVLLISLFLYLKNRRNKYLEGPPLLSPEEAALQAIENLTRLLNGDSKAFYFGLSAIFRDYLSRRFDMGSLKMTTEELLICIYKLNHSMELKREMREFLNVSDSFKFSDSPVLQEKMENDILLVKNIIRQTTPTSK